MEEKDRQRLHVITHAPLISIDLIIRNCKGELLVGFRKNEPAINKWFVPGGSIDKAQDLDRAFESICLKEIGIKINRSEALFIGLFRHEYGTNYLKVQNIGTTYIVLAYELHGLDLIDLDRLPKDQHDKWAWFDQKVALKDENFHEYVLPYYESVTCSNILESQYSILNARRDSYNSLLWQTPVLSLTALAFLFIVSLSQDINIAGQKIAAGFAFIASFASIQLMIKHRFNEVNHGRLLENMEKDLGFSRINVKPHIKIFFKKPWTLLEWIPSHYIWNTLFFLFGIFALLIFFFPCWFKL